MPAAFSRLQLAAALIEYDNDSEDPALPRRKAQESAIFAHLRRNPAARPNMASRKSRDTLGARTDGNTRASIVDTRRSAVSRSSVDALRNPFGADGGSEYDEDERDGEEGPTEMEVDLSSWGLDAFIPDGKTDPRSRKAKEKQGSVPVRSHTISAADQEVDRTSNIAHSRSASTLNMANMRRQSTSSKLDVPQESSLDSSDHPRRRSSHLLASPSGGVIFSSPQPQSTIHAGIESPPEQHPPRAQSRASIGSHQVLEGAGDVRPRSMSQGALDEQQPAGDVENPFTIRPPAHTSRFDPKAANSRPLSTASIGTRQMLDNDDGESIRSHNSFTQNRPYSVVELLRPKVLVMPSPLQSVGPGAQESVREGFQMSKDGPPLPPGARTTRRMSVGLDSVPNPSNSFIPNPNADLTPAQKVFRDTLVSHSPGQGQYIPRDGAIPRAMVDGEQIEFETPPVEEEDQFFGAGQGRPNKPAGKLFGKSLIDDLESRKAHIRSKQRTFTGDQRPTMMARQSNRTSTLIDPATLNARPLANRQSTYGSQGDGLARRGSQHMKPFLSFDEESKHHQDPQSGDRIPKVNKSVFGVDVIWEAEMARLREIEEQERQDAEIGRRLDEEKERIRMEKEQKKKKKKKLKKKDKNQTNFSDDGDDASPPPAGHPDVPIHHHQPPPTLPVIPHDTARKAPKAVQNDDDESSDSDSEAGVARPPPPQATMAWHSDSDEDSKPRGPVRTTGVGLRNPASGSPVVQKLHSDSEEDIPLAAAKMRATQYIQSTEDSSDEDKPLARVVPKSPVGNDFNGSSRLRLPQQSSDDEDSQPLGIRASRLMLNRTGDEEDEDDKPLAFHPDQQRRTQYNLLAHQQVAAQQQHQMMMQAQFQNNMFFNNSMMNPPFFGPGMMPPMHPMGMMQAPIPIPSPPPMHDENKFISVDKWRRDVVVDRDQS